MFKPVTLMFGEGHIDISAVKVSVEDEFIGAGLSLIDTGEARPVGVVTGEPSITQDPVRGEVRLVFTSRDNLKVFQEVLAEADRAFERHEDV